MGYDFFIPGLGLQYSKRKMRILHEGSPQRTGHHLTSVGQPKFLAFGFNFKRKSKKKKNKIKGKASEDTVISSDKAYLVSL